MDKRKTIIQCMTALQTEYPNFHVNDERIQIWVNLLVDVSPPAIDAAVMHILSQPGNFAPVIGNIRSLAKDFEAGTVGQMTAEESWERIMDYIDHKEIALTANERRALGATKLIYDLRRSKCIEADRKAYKDAYSGILNRNQDHNRALPAIKALRERNNPELEHGEHDVNQLVSGLVGKMGER